MLRGRVLAPAFVVLGAAAMLVGAAAVVLGSGLVAAWGVAELVGGFVVIRLGAALWRYQDRQSAHGWPE